MEIQDCVTFPKYGKFPPEYVLGYHGINPKVIWTKLAAYSMVPNNHAY